MNAAAALGQTLARPPWPMLLSVSAAGWLLLLALGTGETAASICGNPASPATVGRLLAMWTVMLLAMMPLLLAHPLRHIARSSLSRRRAASTALFAAGYAATWMAAGTLLLPAAALLRSMFGDVALPIALLLAAAWQVTPLRLSLVSACHRAPSLRALGRGAFIDSLRYGHRWGAACVGTCWALMLTPLAAAEYHGVIMPAAALAVILERHWPKRDGTFNTMSGAG